MNYNTMLAGIFFVLSFVFMLLPLLFMLKRRKMLRDGVRVAANVTDVEICKAEKGKHGVIRYKHTYSLEYTADSNAISTKTSYRTVKQEQEYAVGDKMEIMYLPEKPESVFAYNNSNSFLNRVAPVAGVALGGVIAFIAGVLLILGVFTI